MSAAPMMMTGIAQKNTVERRRFIFSAITSANISIIGARNAMRMNIM